jgi:hypothetical protein
MNGTARQLRQRLVLAALTASVSITLGTLPLASPALAAGGTATYLDVEAETDTVSEGSSVTLLARV